MQVSGWSRFLRAYSVDLPSRSSVDQRSQADQLATRIAELAGLGELAVAGGNWNSYGRADPITPAAWTPPHRDRQHRGGVGAGPRRRPWERRRTDPDYLLLRLGTADLPSAVGLTDPVADERRRRLHWLIADAPVTVPLAERAVAGVAGPGDVPRLAGRWLVAQLAILHSPEDVHVCVLTGASGQAAWEWARWLPHARPAEGQNCAVLIGNDAETVAARIAELQAIITARQQTPREQAHGRNLVVILDGSRRLRSLPGAIQVLRDGPEVGVYSVCLDADERLLPAECHAVVAARPDGALAVQ